MLSAEHLAYVALSWYLSTAARGYSSLSLAHKACDVVVVNMHLLNVESKVDDVVSLYSFADQPLRVIPYEGEVRHAM